MQKLEIIDEEYHFEEGLIISSTDLSGIITYANRKFCEIAGHTRDELIGKNHNIIRHHYGKYYWFYSHISPIVIKGEVTEFTAARRPTSKAETEETLVIYAKMLEKENN